MKFVKYLLGIVVLLVVVGLLLPSTTHVERQTVIKAPAGVVFGYINNYRNFNKWSPWLQRDPDTQYEFSGPASGVGSKMSWASDHKEVGTGSQEIVESVPNSHLKVRLDFGAQGQSDASWSLTESETGTQVVWAMDMDHGWNILSRAFGLMMDGLVGPDFEAGLRGLKQISEADVAG